MLQCTSHAAFERPQVLYRAEDRSQEVQQYKQNIMGFIKSSNLYLKSC